MSAERKQLDESRDADGEPAAQPDADADRSAPGKGRGTGDARQQPRRPPMEIREIEQIEDDAPGG